MSKKEKKWRLFYKVMMSLIYAVILPLSAILYLIDEATPPWGIIIVAIALPFMRKNHINQIRQRGM